MSGQEIILASINADNEGRLDRAYRELRRLEPENAKLKEEKLELENKIQHLYNDCKELDGIRRTILDQQREREIKLIQEAYQCGVSNTNEIKPLCSVSIKTIYKLAGVEPVINLNKLYVHQK